MQYQIRKVAIILVLSCISLWSHAQNDNFSITPNVGISTPILDNGTGFHIGVNPAYALSSRFYIEGQLSYAHTKISSSFLSGNTGRVHSINTLAGGRLYLNSKEKKNRYFLNLLVGMNYNNEVVGDYIDKEFNFGFSGGGFAEFKKILVGLAYDTPQNLTLKVGWVF